MSNLWQLARTHPKKLLLAAGVSGCIYKYVLNKYDEEVSRRLMCSSVKPRGFETIRPTQRLRRLTVFLNPFARHGSLLTEFDKNVAPLLQLSGLDVQMVYTDNDAQVKDLIKVLDPMSTDGILVASDDHVLQKVLSALLQRPDFKTSLRSMPVGVVPVGIWNAFANSFVSREVLPKWCYDTLLPVLNEVVKRRHVLQVSVIPVNLTEDKTKATPILQSVSSSPKGSKSDEENQVQDSSSIENLTTYAISGVEWSVWRDVEHGGGAGAPKSKAKPIDTNEHRGQLKPLSLWSPGTWTRNFGVIWRYTWFWMRSCTPSDEAIIQQVPELAILQPYNQSSSATTRSTTRQFTRRFRTKRARVVYTPACSGCSSCWEARLEAMKPVGGPKPFRSNTAFGRLFGLSQPRPVPVAKISDDRSAVVNPDCGREHTLYLDSSAGIIMALEDDHIRLDVMRASVGLVDHIRRSKQWLSGERYVPVSSPHSGDSKGMQPPADVKTISCSTVRLYPDIYENEFYWIDNDHFEACPIEVRVLYNAISMYQ
ncbi:unnamed protein product [Calicophoron daubneyi]|uniref:DAGKc domain-containing protein n=1 Tax=Calicophoron daubneyi TaxID=300641 RepID=A0AAV2TYR4_CALDB